MTKQILLRMTDTAYKLMKNYMELHGFESNQDFIREAIREIIYEESGFNKREIRELKKKIKTD